MGYIGEELAHCLVVELKVATLRKPARKHRHKLRRQVVQVAIAATAFVARQKLLHCTRHRLLLIESPLLLFELLPTRVRPAAIRLRARSTHVVGDGAEQPTEGSTREGPAEAPSPRESPSKAPEEEASWDRAGGLSIVVSVHVHRRHVHRRIGRGRAGTTSCRAAHAARCVTVHPSTSSVEIRTLCAGPLALSERLDTGGSQSDGLTAQFDVVATVPLIQTHDGANGAVEVWPRAQLNDPHRSPNKVVREWRRRWLRRWCGRWRGVAA
jgi:hypothetical protein